MDTIDTQRYEFLGHALHGSGGFSDGGYLIKYPREGDEKLARRKEVAWYPNPMRRACERFVGYLSRRPPVRDVHHPLIAEFAEDCNWRGDALDVFWQSFMLEAKARGTMLLLVDMPAALPPDQASQVAQRAFPYLVPIAPERVQEYRTNARGLLEFVSWNSTIEVDGKQVAVLQEWDATEWRISLSGEVIDSKEHGLGQCPVLIFSESGAFPAEGALSAIADMGLRLYNLLSELDELLRSQTFSILAYQVPPESAHQFDAKKVAETIGTHNMLVHSGQIPAFISPTSLPTEAYYKAIALIEQAIDEVGLNVEPPGQAESGLAMTLRFQALNSSLSSFARRMEDFERRLIDIVCLWLRVPNRTNVSWAKDYGLADLAMEIEIYQQMQAMGAPDSYLVEKMRQIVSLDLSSSEQDVIDTIDNEITTMSHERGKTDDPR